MLTFGIFDQFYSSKISARPGFRSRIERQLESHYWSGGRIRGRSTCSVGRRGQPANNGTPKQPSKLAQNPGSRQDLRQGVLRLQHSSGCCNRCDENRDAACGGTFAKKRALRSGNTHHNAGRGSSFTNPLSVLGQGAGTAASGANFLRPGLSQSHQQ